MNIKVSPEAQEFLAEVIVKHDVDDLHLQVMVKNIRVNPQNLEWDFKVTGYCYMELLCAKMDFERDMLVEPE